MKKRTPLLLGGLLFMASLSCERLKKQTREIAGGAVHKVAERKNALKDKLIRTYDFNAPDTDNNKKRFSEHLQTTLTPDVKNIYAYGDFLGIDFKVLMAFDCDSTTVERIVKQKNMRQLNQAGEGGLFFTNEFKWWDKEKLETLRPYKVGKEYEYWELLWYDAKQHKAWYEIYSL